MSARSQHRRRKVFAIAETYVIEAPLRRSAGDIFGWMTKYFIMDSPTSADRPSASADHEDVGPSEASQTRTNDADAADGISGHNNLEEMAVVLSASGGLLTAPAAASSNTCEPNAMGSVNNTSISWAVDGSDELGLSSLQKPGKPQQLTSTGVAATGTKKLRSAVLSNGSSSETSGQQGSGQFLGSSSLTVAAMPIGCYLGRDLSTNELVVMYVQKLSPLGVALRGVVHQIGMILSALWDVDGARHIPGVPRCLHWGTSNNKYESLVMPALGPKLASLLRYCGGRLSEKTVVLLGIQLLEMLQHFHSKSVIHNDLSPHTLRFGASTLDSHVVYASSLAFSVLTVCPAPNGAAAHVAGASGSRCQPQSNASSAPGGVSSTSLTSHVGDMLDSEILSVSARSGRSAQGVEPTLAAALEANNVARHNNLFFCSARYHLGLPLSHADDVESLAFVLAYCYSGELPWRVLVDENRGVFHSSRVSADDASASPAKEVSQARQLYKMKEQFVLHSHRSELPPPVKLLFSSVQKFNRNTKAPGAQDQHLCAASQVARCAETQQAYVELLCAFRLYLRDTLATREDYVFDWNFMLPRKHK